MLRVILSVLGISQIWIMSRDSWRQWRKLRVMKKEYLAALHMSDTTWSRGPNNNNAKRVSGSNSSSSNDTPTATLLEEKTKKPYMHDSVAAADYHDCEDGTTTTPPFNNNNNNNNMTTVIPTNNNVVIPPVLKEYARLVLELKSQENKMVEGAKDRMRNIASMPMVLCAVGFIPACISSFGGLYNDAATPTYNDYDQSVVTNLLIVLAVWCSFSILQTIFWYRIVPSYVHRKVIHKLVKKKKLPVIVGNSNGRGGNSNGRRLPRIYHQRTLLRLLAAASMTTTTTTTADQYNSNSGKMILVTPQSLEQYQHDIRKHKLEKRVISLTNQMIFLQFIYPFHDILNWLTYPIMLLLQIMILYFLWWWPKSENYNTPMKAQTMFSVWIFVINVILVVAAPSVRDDEDEEEEEEDDEDDVNDQHHTFPHHRYHQS